MPTVNIVREFTYQHPDGYKEVIPPGSYELEDDLANSVYVRAHSDNPIRPKLSPGMPQHAIAQATYEADQGRSRVGENQVAEQAALEARSEFRRANQEVQARRPNQRRTMDDPEPSPEQVQNDEMEERRAVAESMGQKLPDDQPRPARARIGEPQPQPEQQQPQS